MPLMVVVLQGRAVTPLTACKGLSSATTPPAAPHSQRVLLMAPHHCINPQGQVLCCAGHQARDALQAPEGQRPVLQQPRMWPPLWHEAGAAAHAHNATVGSRVAQ